MDEQDRTATSPTHTSVSDKQDLERFCPSVRETLSFVGDKWSILVVVVLEAGTLRFNEIDRRLAGISQRMLARTLRGLERDGLVSRSVAPTVPPSVSYELTRLGQTLLPPVAALARWAQLSTPDIHAAQARFDASR